jgi:sugar (pentulose or hexulose) kinase
VSYLAFDLGGSGGKLFLGSLRGDALVLDEVHRFANAPVAAGAGLYWSLFGIFEQLGAGLRLAARRSAGDPIVSLGLDSFSNDFSLIDRNGEVLIPLRCYRDRRT